ncbi:MarR family winged helix-turn-helix transcriptional regulator [Methylobacterium frigidaeris]|uniref:Organic hydroperoxide resistance transcriptional regulator n=1 Tax=Methylobacterium frigidaeris TaxID=2038277 RepID=A0AA37HHK2_9HYPH|nr:MarR family transcriptional regulator [Methylobacterium frigidaeris]GJD65908.1 Organic hydroperoxide resistance transcriptional regulator [Methylobacterium frigidaeris]
MSAPDDPLRLDHQLCFAVYAAAHAFSAAYKPLLEPFGLSYPQYLVLLTLWERDGLSVKEIGARLELDSGTLTPLLKRLEASGYLTRVRVPGNERQLQVGLTDTGRSLRERIGSVRAQIVCALGDSEEPIQDLRLELRRITPLLRNLPTGEKAAE